MSATIPITATPAPPPRARSPWPSAVTVLATSAVIALLYAGRDFIVPIAIALLFSAILRPAVRWMENRRVPTVAGATLVVLLTLGALVSAGYLMAGPIRGFAARVPESIGVAQQRLERLRRPMQQITQVAAQLENPVPGTAPDSTHRKPATAPPPAPAVPGFMGRLVGTTTSLLSGMVEVVLLAWLLLASGDLFMDKLMRVLPFAADRRTALQVVRETESAVAGYVFTSALISGGQGIAVAIAVHLLGMPQAPLWGVLTFVFEFVPYLGAVVMIGLLSVVSLTTFDSALHALAVPGAYLAISTLQNNLVSPLVYGRRLRLNPVAVLVGVMFWWALWGLAGAFLAVPIIATAKVLGDHLPDLKAMGEFLGA
jgi:predicted PurR-regulated permease PerM